jgi:hypothetical protein
VDEKERIMRINPKARMYMLEYAVLIANGEKEKKEGKEMGRIEIDEEIESLWCLTGQESGIVVYENEAIICNWSANAGLPRICPLGGLIDWPLNTPMTLAEQEEVSAEDLSEIMSFLEVLYDENGDAQKCIDREFAGTGYTLSDGTIIIAPVNWN